MDTCADDTANGKAPSDAERQKKLESLLGKLPDGGTINSEDEDGDVEMTDKDNIREFRKTSGKKVNEDDAHDGSIIGFSPQGKDYDEYPKSTESDRGSQFVSYFWKQLCQRIGTTPKLSSAYHPETDGQTERANGLLKIYLRTFVNFHQDDWESDVEWQIAAGLACLVWEEDNDAAD